MTFRTLLAAAALTSATALSAFAADDNIMEKGHTIMTPDGPMNVAEVTETYSVKGKEVQAGDTDVDATATKDVADQSRSNFDTQGERDVVLGAAETGAPVHTYRGEMIGTVYATEDIGDAGHLVYVDVASEAGLPVERLGFYVDTLSAVEGGTGLEYEADMAYLRENV